MTLHTSARATWAGRDRPHGTPVNFSVFSKDADFGELLLFDDLQATEAAETIPLDPRLHRAYHCWHAFVPGVHDVLGAPR